MKTCKNIERGIRFDSDGVHCCCANTWQSPAIISVDELNSGKATYDLMLERRKQLYDDLNHGFPQAGDCLRCAFAYETETPPDFTRLGGSDLPSGFNISVATACNMRCTYCLLTVEDNFHPARYQNFKSLIEEFRVRDKLNPDSWIEFNGGEPTILPDFEQTLSYLVDNRIGHVCLFTNAIVYKQSVFDGLASNRIHLTTSIDCGTPETFQKIRGVPAKVFDKVINTLRRYRDSGSANILLKYIITDDNRTDADLEGFVALMRELCPAQVYICPDFPYGDRQIPRETVEFGARMWSRLEQSGLNVYIQTRDMVGDPKLKQFTTDIQKEHAKMEPTCRVCGAPGVRPRCNGTYEAFFKLRVDVERDPCLTRAGTTTWLCRTCMSRMPAHEFTESELSGLYRDYRQESYNRERLQVEPSYQSTIDAYRDPKFVEARCAAANRFLSRNMDAMRKCQSVLDYGGFDGEFTPSVLRELGEVRLHDLTRPDLQSADLVLFMHILEHVGNPLELVRKTLETARMIFIEIPLELPLIQQPPQPFYIHEHINHFSALSMLVLARAVNCTVVDWEAVVLAGYGDALLGRYLLEKRDV
jgi:uncharacterized Fe-S cluster-containing radical SAM superfamily protein